MVPLPPLTPLHSRPYPSTHLQGGQLNAPHDAECQAPASAPSYGPPKLVRQPEAESKPLPMDDDDDNDDDRENRRVLFPFFPSRLVLFLDVPSCNIDDSVPHGGCFVIGRAAERRRCRLAPERLWRSGMARAGGWREGGIKAC